MVPSILNEGMADQAVIRSLLRTIHQLTKGNNIMSKITLFKDNNVIMRATQFGPVCREEIIEGIEATEEALASLKQALIDFDTLNPVVETPVVTTDTPAVEAVTETPVADIVAEPLTDTTVVPAEPVATPEVEAPAPVAEPVVEAVDPTPTPVVVEIQ